MLYLAPLPVLPVWPTGRGLFYSWDSHKPLIILCFFLSFSPKAQRSPSHFSRTWRASARREFPASAFQVHRRGLSLELQLLRRDFAVAFCLCSLHRTHFRDKLNQPHVSPLPPNNEPIFQRLSWAVTQKVRPWLGLTTESWPLYLGNTGPEHICIQPRLCAHIVNGRRPDSWRWMKLKPSLITSLSPQGGCSTALLCHLGPCTVSILTQAFHFHAFIFITRQTFPASLLSGKHLSLFPVPAFLILFHYNHLTPSGWCVCVCVCVSPYHQLLASHI